MAKVDLRKRPWVFIICGDHKITDRHDIALLLFEVLAQVTCGHYYKVRIKASVILNFRSVKFHIKVGLDIIIVRGSNPGGGRDLFHPPRTALGHTQFSIQWAPGLFPVGEGAGAWR